MAISGSILLPMNNLPKFLFYFDGTIALETRDRLQISLLMLSEFK